jgi:iron(III) transport system substrate-binding protein
MPRMTYHAVIAVSVGLLALAASAMAAEMTALEKQLYEAAKKEGKLTWYSAQYSTKQSEDHAQEFSKRYPGVTVDVIRTTGQVAYARLTQDLRARAAQCDIFSGTDIGHYVTLKKNKQLLKFVPENHAKLRPAYKNLDPDGYYFTTSANPTVMIYNTNLVKKEDAPKNWTDLTDPKWTNKVAVAHPGFSGSMGSWTVLMAKLYGWEFFDKLKKVNPLVGRSLLDPPTILNAGERAVGISSMTTATKLVLDGNPIVIVYPTDGVKLTLSATGIPANAPHPNAAKLFANYLLSAENSVTLVKWGGQPLHADVAPPKGVLSIDEMKVAPLSEEEVVAKVPDAIERWRDIFGN